MATKRVSETYRNAIIDCDDLTITEIFDDDSNTYSLMNIIKRWAKIGGVTLTLTVDKRVNDVVQDKTMLVYEDESKV